MVSRRRRRQGIGKIVVSVESRIRKIEKNPSPKRLKANVVTTEKLGFRAVTTKTVAPDAITPNEAAFGTTVVSDTQPTDYLKEGTTWVNPGTGAAKVYDPAADDFVDLTAVDLTARASADGKNTVYRQTSQPTGGTYVTGDVWFDSDDNNKIYRYNGSTWVAVQLGGNGLANINANSITSGTIDASVITVSNLDAGNITTGGMSAARITTGTLNAITITSATMTGSTVTGGTIRTAATGSRVELTSTSSNRIDFWGSGTAQGAISANNYRIFMYAPSTTYASGAVLSLYGDSDSTPNGIFMTGGTDLALAFAMSSSTISLASGVTYKLRITSAGVIVDGAASLAASTLRNIRISTSAPTSGSDSSSYADGSVLLVREA